MARTKATTTNELKNKIVLFVGCGDSKKRHELFNFSKLDHLSIDNVSYVRVLCDSKYYYFKTVETSIAEIENF